MFKGKGKKHYQSKGTGKISLQLEGKRRKQKSALKERQTYVPDSKLHQGRSKITIHLKRLPF